MRLTRRRLVLAGVGLRDGLDPAGRTRRPVPPSEPTPVAVKCDADRVVRRRPDRERRDFGALTFRFGPRLTVAVRQLRRLLRPVAIARRRRDRRCHRQHAVADRATSSRRTGGSSASPTPSMAPILGAGRPAAAPHALLRHRRSRHRRRRRLRGDRADPGGDALQLGARTACARAANRCPVPADAKQLPRNKGLEAIGVAPPRSPLAGAVVVIAERADLGRERADPRLHPHRPAAGRLRRGRARASTTSTDLAFLPSGDMLLLERRFSILRGIAARLRRIAADAASARRDRRRPRHLRGRRGLPDRQHGRARGPPRAFRERRVDGATTTSRRAATCCSSSS